MKPTLESFVHPGLADAEPYDATHHDFAWGHPELDRLMSNECPIPPSQTVIAAANEALLVGNLYPHSGPELRAALARFSAVATDSVILGNGSTEVLDLVTRALIGPGDEAVISVPTYAFFETQTRLYGGTPVLVPLTESLAFDVPGILRAMGPRTKAVFLCSPNNPTGNSLTVDELRSVLESGIPTVVDQAYLECGYSTSFAPLVEAHRNLVVTRTMSKAFGLAAVRIGYAIADPWLVDVLHRLKIPFSLNLVGLRACLAAVSDPAYIQFRQEYISSERDRLFAALQEIPGIAPIPSDGNFILIDISATGFSATQIVALVRKEDILIRAMTAHHLRERHVRVTIGTAEQNDRFLTVFRKALGNHASREASTAR